MGGVDESRWPVVVVRIGPDTDVEEAAGVVAALDEVVARGQRMGLVFDYQQGQPAAVELVSKWLAEQMDSLERVVAAGVTVVAPDAVERVQGMITSGMFTLPFPTWATATVDEAETWISSQLDPPDRSLD